jgi:hypothetical protein
VVWSLPGDIFQFEQRIDNRRLRDDFFGARLQLFTVEQVAVILIQILMAVKTARVAVEE